MKTLKWNSFNKVLSTGIADLCSQNTFTDVTFYINKDGQNTSECNFKAHKAILSSGSPYFKRILSEYHREEEPQISIDGLVRPQHFSHILTFLYNGQVSVNKEDLKYVKSLLQMFEIAFEEENSIQDLQIEREPYYNEELFEDDFVQDQEVEDIKSDDYGLNELEEPKEKQQKFDTPEEFECDICDFRTHTKRILTMHQTSVHVAVSLSGRIKSKKIYSCIRCHVKFDRLDHLRLHMNKVITFKCKLCDFLTCKRSYLHLHLSKEHGRNSFKSQRECVAEQQRKRAFRCDRCGKGFNTKNQLSAHERKIQKFACSLCKYVTCSIEVINKHTSDVHEACGLATIYSCSLCGYRTPNGQTFTSHRKSQHPLYADRVVELVNGTLK